MSAETVQPGDWLTLGLSNLSHAIRDVRAGRARMWCGKSAPTPDLWRPERARDRCRTCTQRRDRAFTRAVDTWAKEVRP